ncbi:MAG: AtpZ/AtpI family protein [Dehalococcoidales bacterium]|nr:AtpZ/AtpI family protein [Dehalococcoidales bacterium]
MPKWVLALRLTGVGFFIGGAIFLGVVGGIWIDGKLNTRPAFMLIGLLLGIIVAGFGVYQMLLPLLNSKQDEERN